MNGEISCLRRARVNAFVWRARSSWRTRSCSLSSVRTPVCLCFLLRFHADRARSIALVFDFPTFVFWEKQDPVHVFLWFYRTVFAFQINAEQGNALCCFFFFSWSCFFFFFFGLVGSGFVAFESSTKWVRRLFDGFATCVMNLFVVGEWDRSRSWRHNNPGSSSNSSSSWWWTRHAVLYCGNYRFVFWFALATFVGAACLLVVFKRIGYFHTREEMYLRAQERKNRRDVPKSSKKGSGNWKQVCVCVCVFVCFGLVGKCSIYGTRWERAIPIETRCCCSWNRSVSRSTDAKWIMLAMVVHSCIKNLQTQKLNLRHFSLLLENLQCLYE